MAMATIQKTLAGILTDAAKAAASELGIEPSDLPVPELDQPRVKEHGDWATNLALVLAPRAKRPPRQVAEAIAKHIEPGGYVNGVQVAGTGFINLFLGPGWLHDALKDILRAGESYGRRQAGSGDRVIVEFVSANPTGPLHVGTARNAAIGDSFANILTALGHRVEREYYFNDTGRQVDLWAASLEARYLQALGIDVPLPEEGYRGEYLKELAAAIVEDAGDRWVESQPEERRSALQEEGFRRTLDAIRATLARFRVSFDSWKTESELETAGLVDEAVARLREAGLVYDHEGAVWFRSIDFGDDKDRVLIRRTGAPTYFAKDAAYLLDKDRRGYARFVYVWGADHHGDVKRVSGAAQALGIDPARLEFLLYQLVSLYRGGEEVRMSKRTGELVTLEELIDEVGTDAARYTLLTRSPDSQLDFDIEAVTRQTLDNPVYYVQYAHARIASLLRRAAEQGVQQRPWEGVELERLEHPSELDLIRKLQEYPDLVELAGSGRAPHRLTRYAEEVAAAFHRFYTDCRVITDDAPLTQARLWLSAAAKQVIASALGLLGVSAPQAMERIGDDD
jgi:arginyl-tRNA synthetase